MMFVLGISIGILVGGIIMALAASTKLEEVKSHAAEDIWMLTRQNKELRARLYGTGRDFDDVSALKKQTGAD